MTKEHWCLNREHALRAHDRNDCMIAESEKSAIESANVAIRAILLINGGAVVALLAFLGTLENADAEAVNLALFVSALCWFACGVGFAATTGALAYLVNLQDAAILASRKYDSEHPYLFELPRLKWLRPVRVFLHFVALGLAVSALAAFFLGINAIVDAVTDLGL